MSNEYISLKKYSLDSYIDEAYEVSSAYDDEEAILLEATYDEYIEMYASYMTELELYQEGEVWDYATNKGTNTNTFVKIISFLPRLFIAVAKAIYSWITNKKVKDAANNVRQILNEQPSSSKSSSTALAVRGSSNPATPSRGSSSSDVETMAVGKAEKLFRIDAQYFRSLGDAVEKIYAAASNMADVIGELLIKTCNGTKVRPQEVCTALGLKFPLKFTASPLIKKDGTAVYMEKVGKFLLESQEKLADAAKAAKTDKDKTRKWANDSRGSGDEKAEKMQWFLKQTILPFFAAFTNYSTKVSGAVANALTEFSNFFSDKQMALPFTDKALPYNPGKTGILSLAMNEPTAREKKNAGTLWTLGDDGDSVQDLGRGDGTISMGTSKWYRKPNSSKSKRINHGGSSNYKNAMRVHQDSYYDEFDEDVSAVVEYMI